MLATTDPSLMFSATKEQMIAVIPECQGYATWAVMTYHPIAPKSTHGQDTTQEQALGIHELVSIF
jgi:hypothetical protein